MSQQPLWQTDFDPYEALILLHEQVQDLTEAMYDVSAGEQFDPVQTALYRRTSNLERRIAHCEAAIEEINRNLQWIAQYLGRRD